MFDRLEDVCRGRLSHFPIPYGFIGGIGIVLFWRGVWHSADYAMLLVRVNSGLSSTDLAQEIWWDGPLSFIVGSLLLLITGLFVSNFIGNEIIMSGLRGEKKLSEKTETEVRTEVGAIAEIREEIRALTAKSAAKPAKRRQLR